MTFGEPPNLDAMCRAVKNFPNALTTAAFYTIRNQWHCVHGGVLQNALDMYKLSVTMKNFLFTSPFLWEGFNGVDFGDKKVHWLLAVPISSPAQPCLILEIAGPGPGVITLDSQRDDRRQAPCTP